jgi:hypothetical protein
MKALLITNLEGTCYDPRGPGAAPFGYSVISHSGYTAFDVTRMIRDHRLPPMFACLSTAVIITDDADSVREWLGSVPDYQTRIEVIP